MEIAILGDGAFGTALAQLCALNGHAVTLWCFNHDVASMIEKKRCNEIYLPSIILHEGITAVTSMESAVRNAQWIIEAIPTTFMYSVISLARPYVQDSTPWVIASKGIDAETMRLPSHMLYHALEMEVPFVILSGPSFADELAKGQPTAVMLASNELDLAYRFKSVVDNESFFTHITQDTKGVELCGVFKNIIALALGLLEGAGYGKNARALVLAQAINEVSQLVLAAGGNEGTVMSLAGLGDIVLTAYSEKSRNKSLGIQIGKGHYEALNGSYVESIQSLRAAKGLRTLLFQQGTTPLSRLPFFSALYDVVFHRKNPDELIAACSSGMIGS